MQTIFERVAHWNAQRYERTYNNQLTFDLLLEEYEEWMEADRYVDRVDAICDMIYVAAGGLWKAGISSAEAAMRIKNSSEIIEGLDNLTDVVAILYRLKHNLNEGMQIHYLILVIVENLRQLHRMGFTARDMREALLIVCDANDSKKVVKTSSDVKANAGDKGEGFQPPEERLLKLMEEIECRKS